MIRALIFVLCIAAAGVLVYAKVPDVQAQLDGRFKSAMEQIKQRAEHRWEHVLDDAISKAHAYYTPGYRASYRIFKTASQYGGQVQRDSVSVDRVEMSAEAPQRAVVYYTVNVAVDLGADGGEVVFPSEGREVWIKRGSLWWYAGDFPYS